MIRFYVKNITILMTLYSGENSILNV